VYSACIDEVRDSRVSVSILFACILVYVTTCASRKLERNFMMHISFYTIRNGTCHLSDVAMRNLRASEVGGVLHHAQNRKP